jgi:hypothetical protein
VIVVVAPRVIPVAVAVFVIVVIVASTPFFGVAVFAFTNAEFDFELLAIPSARLFSAGVFVLFTMANLSFAIGLLRYLAARLFAAPHVAFVTFLCDD